MLSERLYCVNLKTEALPVESVYQVLRKKIKNKNSCALTFENVYKVCASIFCIPPKTKFCIPPKLENHFYASNYACSELSPETPNP